MATAKSADIYKQMQKTMKQADAYTPINSSDVYSDLASRVNFFKPQYQELSGLESKAYSAPASLMKDYYGKYGGDNAMKGPSALAQLSSIMDNIGQQYGTIGALRGGIDTQKGKLSDLANTVSNQYTAQKGAVMDKYNMLQPLYQTANSNEENSRNRAFQAQQAAASRAQAAAQAAQANAANMAALKAQQQAQDKAAILGQMTQIKAARGQGMIGQEINDYAADMYNQARQAGLPISMEDIWVGLGNTPSKGYKPNKFLY